MNTAQNTVLPPCCQTCVAEGSIDEARLAMAYENGRDEARNEFKEYLEKKAIESGKKRDADLSLGSSWDEWNDRHWTYRSIIDELFGETEQDNSDREE